MTGRSWGGNPPQGAAGLATAGASGCGSWTAGKGRRAGVGRLIRDGDIFLDFRFQKEDEVLTPGEGKLTVRRCVLAQVWRDHQAEDLGRIFCEEVYRGICETYDPSIQVEIPQTLAEGCSCCRLHLTKT